MKQHNVSICVSPKLIERQSALLCGKHAINNLLQKKQFATCGKLEDIASFLAIQYNIPIDSLVNRRVGYYDISVIMYFLTFNNYDIIVVPKTKHISETSKRQSNKLIGYIFGNGHHWLSIRRTKTTSGVYSNCYYLLDSLHNKPTKINLKDWLKENPQELGIKVLKK